MEEGVDGTKELASNRLGDNQWRNEGLG